VLRIKTEREFIKEFGSNWRIDLNKHFPRGMDIFAGRLIPRSVLTGITADSKGNKAYFWKGWWISMDMIKEDKSLSVIKNLKIGRKRKRASA
jgi:hypothetical protein